MKRALLLAIIDFAEGDEHVGTERYVSDPGDTPANQYFDAVLADVVYERAISCVLWNAGQPFAAPLTELIIDNRDGSYDDWRGKTIKNRLVRVFRAEVDTDNPLVPYMQKTLADFDLVATGLGDEVIVEPERVRITLLDRFLRLFEQGIGEAYTTAGNPSVIGTLRPLVMGQVERAPLKLENTTNNVWDVNNAAYQSLTQLFEDGVPLTLTTDYTTTTTGVDLVKTTAGFLAATLQGSKRGGAFFEDLESCVEWIALDTDRGVLDASELDGTSLAAIAADGYTYCWALTFGDDRASPKCGEVLRTLLDSIAASCWQDRLGVLKFGRLTAPSGSPVLELVEADVLSIAIEPDKGAGLSWALMYNVNYAPAADGDIDPAATASERAAAVRPHSVVTWNGTAHTPHAYYTPAQSAPAARSLLREQADAQAEIERRGDLYASRRWFYRIRARIPEGSIAAYQLEPFDVVKITHSRHGLSSGVSMRVVSAKSSFASNEVELLLWA